MAVPTYPIAGAKATHDGLPDVLPGESNADYAMRVTGATEEEVGRIGVPRVEGPVGNPEASTTATAEHYNNLADRAGVVAGEQQTWS